MTKPAICPNCLSRLEAFTMTPEPGDVSICFKCGALAIYRADMGLKLPTEDDIASWPLRTFIELAAAQRAIREVREGQPI